LQNDHSVICVGEVMALKVTLVWSACFIGWVI